MWRRQSYASKLHSQLVHRRIGSSILTEKADWHLSDHTRGFFNDSAIKVMTGQDC